MSRYDKPDTEIDGQRTIEDWLSPPEKLIAVSRVFARARKEMTLAEQKTFVLALSEIRFTDPEQSNVVYLDKKQLASIVGVNTDMDHMSVDLNNKIKELPRHSFIEIEKEDEDFYDSGLIISRVTMLKNRVRIKFEEEYLPLFAGLTTNYITMWASDLLNMTSIRTLKFYEYLRQNMDTRDESHDVLIGIREFKLMFDIPKSGEGSYMRKDGHFDRPAFEKRIIDPLCEDMQHCKMIKLIAQPDGKFYVKEKQGSRVTGYRFFWDFSARPGIATADEVKKIQERVDADSRVLKVAKDLVNGEKKQKKAGNFEQRNYDYAALERAVLGKEGTK